MSNLQFDPSEVCNINVGVMGHVDSGKTSLGKKLHKYMNTSKISECHFVNCFFRQESTKSSAWYYSGSGF